MMQVTEEMAQHMKRAAKQFTGVPVALAKPKGYFLASPDHTVSSNQYKIGVYTVSGTKYLLFSDLASSDAQQ